MEEKAYLVLEDGTVFQGVAFGSRGKNSGEVVFTTGMAGYQQVLTDPSYCGQIVTFTYPLIGNYGVNNDDNESERPWAEGVVLKELCSSPSNWRSLMKLEDFCREHGIIGISGIDTRALTRRLRNYGTMRGVIATGDHDPQILVEEARNVPSLSEQDLVRTVSTKKVRVFGEGECRIVVVDLGVKFSILRSLLKRNCTVYLVPGWTPAEDILSYRPHGVVFSNGPGDPKAAWYSVETARGLIGKVPLMGICLGHQVLALAFGGDTYKLKFGHRGANHPVKDLERGKVYITSQNHGFAVDAKSLPDEVMVTHINLNDGTVEGLKHLRLPVFSYQFHPEGAPGPLDSSHLFDQFISALWRSN
ncbi:MAG: Carbamoyl-phosphate synthase small chain [Thermoanaerobacterales bacterium 50_218]|nr:MAG: Carbamoyl-phosphate synthase small chain [Thermoanaerobacterales bacterium 50_218]HAA89251.1 carbamoyl phosphate synthase small subunit [Peptococcaceae bacterium]